MFTPVYTRQFQKDLKRTKKRGKNLEKFKTELDIQNGAVVRLAQDVSVDTPVNRFFLYALRSLELRARGALKF